MMITLLPLQKEHLELLLYWLEQPHVQKWWDSDVAWTYEKIMQKYGNRIGNLDSRSGKPIFCFVIYSNQKPIGYVQYYNSADFENECSDSIHQIIPQPCASFDIFIGEQEYCGKGIGTAVLKKLINDYMAKDFKAVCVLVDKQNSAAIKAYQNAGLKILQETNAEIVLWQGF